MGLEIVIIFLLILANGLFAMSEIAVITARKSRLQDWANKGNTKAKVALEIAGSPNQFLSTIQIGITLIGILAGAFAGRTIATRLSTALNAVPGMEPYSEAAGLAVVVIAITYFSLIIGELVPKRVALGYPEGIATVVAVPMRVLSAVSAPAVWMLSVSTEGILGMLGGRSSKEPPVTEEEIKALIRQGTKAGIFEESEQHMVEGVFRLGEKTAWAIMTPRSQMMWLDLKDSLDEIRKKLSESGHSRFPVGDGGLDNVVGVVQAKDLLPRAMAGEPINIHASLQQPFYVPRSAPALQVLELFKQSGRHIALVVDEYGSIEGLLTHHDILEAIAGEIPFGEEPVQPKAVQRQDGSWLLDGMLSVEEFKDIFELENLPGEKRDVYQTLGGFLFTQMGRVPSESDRFEWSRLRFEIVDMDGKRIDKVLVTRQEPRPSGSAPEAAD